MSDYEAIRRERIEANKMRMKEVLQSKQEVQALGPIVKRADRPSSSQTPKPRQPRVAHIPIRASRRLQGSKAEYKDLDSSETESDDEGTRKHKRRQLMALDGSGLVDIMDRGYQADASAYNHEQNKEIQETIRCQSTSRGSLYDSKVGITCHFCRQKKLCGEPNCPRCGDRDGDKECIGKSDCSRCHSATGRFCRACLLIRYGGKLEEVRQEMTNGTWLCPHCYEDEHPNDHWICNSSICMTRRGLKPTGIAIYDAIEQGFKSVGHLLQSQLRKKGGVQAVIHGNTSEEGEEAASPGTPNVPTPVAAEPPLPVAAAASSAAAEDEVKEAGTKRGRGRPRKTAAPLSGSK